MLHLPFITFHVYLPCTPGSIFSLLTCHLTELFSKESVQPASYILNQYASQILLRIRSEHKLTKADILSITLQVNSQPGQPTQCKASYFSLMLKL